MVELAEKEKMALRLLFSDIPYEESCMETLFPTASIDDERMEYLLMLSILGVKNHWKYFPEAFKPRLQGIYRYYRVENITGYLWLQKLLPRLVQLGIPVLFMKGIAMRTYFAPDMPRQMSDYDFAVPEKYFDEAKNIFLEAGWGDTSIGAALHAVTLYKDDFSVDLHRWIFKTHGDKDTDIWRKMLPADFWGISVNVLQPADMIVHILDNRARDVILDDLTHRRMKWLLDVRAVIQKAGKADWGEIAERAAVLGSLSYLKMILPEFAEVFPDILSPAEIDKYFPQDESYRKWLSRADRYRLENERFHKAVSERGEHIYTPYMALRELYHLWMGWRLYFKPELRAVGSNMTFSGFVCRSLKADDLSGLIRKYLPAVKKGAWDGH